MVPTIGRVVHYHAYGTPGGEFKSVPRAAIITDVKARPGHEGVEDETGYEVHVCVLNPSGIFFNKVPYAREPIPGCWTWPPRV